MLTRIERNARKRKAEGVFVPSLTTDSLPLRSSSKAARPLSDAIKFKLNEKEDDCCLELPPLRTYEHDQTIFSRTDRDSGAQGAASGSDGDAAKEKKCVRVFYCAAA